MNTVHTLDLHLAQIVPSRWQPRQHFDPDALQELARSIIDQGLINPVLVFLQNHHYELIAGERRTRAVAALTLWQLFPNAHNLRDWCARLAAVGLTGLGDAEYAALANEPSARIRAAIYPADDLAALHLLAVTENLDRADLSPLEEAYAYKGLMDAYAWSQRDLADRVNKSQSYIAQRLALLNLGAAALDALSTQVLTLTHARAIAAVPEKIQDAATTWAIRATGKDDTPATTRQVENQMRAIAAFADPARWQPNGEHVYTPQQRNRLGVIRMLISGPFAAERVAQNLQSLLEFKNYYETRNLVTSKPLTIVEDDSLYAGVTNALGMRPQDAWQNYAVSEKRECHTCELYGANPGVYHPGIKPCCPRWTAKYTDAGPCENHLGPFDPVVIPVDDYDIRQEFAENPASESLVIQEPFAHTRDVAAYAEAYRSAVEKRQERQKAGDEAKVNGPRRAAQEFWEWQQSLPQEYLQLSNAHRCDECRYFTPLNGKAPCYFALNPLTDRWEGPRAPEHGILVGPTLTMLPRCEMYTWRAGAQPPYKIYQVPGFSAGNDKNARSAFMQWMHAAIHFHVHSPVYGRSVIWRGPFAWLGACSDGKYRWDEISAYLLRNWETFADGGMATLLTAFTYEVKVAYNYDQRGNPLTLLDLRDGKADTWMPLRFKDRNTEQRDWPDQWLKPWQVSP